MTCKMFFCQSLCVYSIWLFSFCYFGLTHTARTGLIFATCAQDRATIMQQWSTLNNFIEWILPLHVCGSWLASSSSVFEKLPGRQPLKRSLLLSESICGKPLKRSLSLSESIYDTVIIRVHVWQTLNAIFVTKFQYHLIFNFTFSLMDTPNTTHSEHTLNTFWTHSKKIHRQFHFQHSDLFEQMPSPRHQSLMSLYDRFSGARAACNKRIGSMKPIWTSSFGQGPHLTWKSHFQQQVVWGTRLVLLEQSSFIKFKSCPHLWIVEKRAYSAPELCVYKLPSALPLKL